MNRNVKIALFGLLGGASALAVLKGQHAQFIVMAAAFVVGFLVVAALATFATKEKRS
jgi:hypothetical protein